MHLAPGARLGAYEIIGLLGWRDGRGGPEQARGQVVDKRTDIWAFGCVVYELLTGRRAFGGATVSDAIAAIIEREPDWTRLPDGLTPGARRLLRQCLEKDPKRRLRDIGDVLLQLDETPSADPAPPTNTRRSLVSRLAWLAAGGALALASVAGWLWVSPTDAPARNVQLQRLTDFVGMEESPAISPDGNEVLFVARAGGKRQIWRRALKRGPPRQITFDDVDHEQPRWAPDSSLIYFVPSVTPGEHGTISEIPALGGEPRRLAAALSGGDLSHDGRHIALFRFDGAQIALVVVTRDGSVVEQVRPMPPNSSYEYPRWSPDDRWIAFQRDNLDAVFDERILVVPAAPGGDAREMARGTNLSGLSWLPDGSGVVYSSSAGSTLLYPPLFNLRAVERDGGGDRQLTFGDVSYVEPDVHLKSGMVTASLIRMQSDIWKFPSNGTPAENTRRGLRITHQTGQAQTPSVSPDDSEVVYLSDIGGHSNLWIARTDGSGVPRQITFELDPAIIVGVPVWSPKGNEIVFISTRPGMTGLSLVNRDGSPPRPLVPFGISASWSADGRWVYYSRTTDNGICIEKVAIEGGPAISVRCGNANASAPTLDGSLYFVNLLIKSNGTLDHEIGWARPENGPSSVLDRVSGARVPVNRRYCLPVLSPDEKLLTVPLLDGGTSNIWVKPTSGDRMRALTDFGDRSVVIARRVSWSSDSLHVYAAVADTDADIVLLSGLVGAR